jgi:predicted metal-dependent phosphotriesterase family hydrolase
VSKIATAVGEINADDLGPTLSHEHLFINMMQERRGDGLVHDEGLLIEELAVFARQGGGAILDLTTAELTPGSTPDSDSGFDAHHHGQTRNPKAVEGIQRISRATGIHVVLGAGRYRDPFLSTELISRVGVDGIAEEMVRDLREGIPGTTAKAGIIGEIGADKWYVSESEATVFKAAAHAHLKTGAAIYTHAARWPVGLEQLAILRSEGADPTKIVIGHTDTVPTPGYATQLARHGVYVGIDTINSKNPREVGKRVDQVMELVREGYLERILLAHDVCLMSHLSAYGGNGFGFVLGGFRDALLAAGLGEGEFNEIMSGNPARLLCQG